MMYTSIITTAAVMLLQATVSSSFTLPSSNTLIKTTHFSSSSSSSLSAASDDIVVEPCSNMKDAAEFMVDSFWLNSPQGLVMDGVDVSDGAKAKLVEEQVFDLEDKYGERLGKRTLDTTLLQAVDGSGTILGLVALEVSLLDTNVGDTISSSASEDWIKSSIASLGPKQRRLYKYAKLSKICEELMPPHLEAVAVLSNLVVSPEARRKGIAQKLYDEVTSIAKDKWNYDMLWLRVESENLAARSLYQGKLGFGQIYSLPKSTGLRVGGDGSEFEKVTVETLVLAKPLVSKKTKQMAM